VRENSGRLLVANLKKLFQSLAQCLADPDHHIPLQALGLLADIAPDCIHDVGNFIPLILVWPLVMCNHVFISCTHF
jgi:hypothetical protein